ncbi:D-amino-acid transaminase [Desulfonema ishimotonii]|uniref:D-alanine aminotransferase n=1 Tax=Desulfonema ishimotonii TaxID=45657 RepID=A0A401FU56_9BACT|nr:D-amino-acid transaminase [Desulfonema ishimotonii]GBC60485.1 D-amino-acid transaminase [Desulfonema ishimotonii]
MHVYFNGDMMPKNEVSISPDDRGFIFGDGVYEVIVAYDGRFFRADAHFERLRRSLRALKIQEPDMAALRAIPEKLLRANNLEEGEATVYLQITRGAAPRKHPFPDKDTPVTVYGFASRFVADESAWEDGVKVISVPDIRWMRCDIKSVSLLPNVLASQQAKENNAKEAIFVRDGAITEGAHTSFAAIFDGCFVTYPETHYILPGITRTVAIGLCREFNIPVREFPILENELKDADECMLLGTTTEVMPVVQVDDRMVGDGRPGPVTRKLQNALRKLIRN